MLLSRIINKLTPYRWLYSFFSTISLRIRCSRLKSANIALSMRFSSSRSFSLLISDASIPPFLAQFTPKNSKKVCRYFRGGLQTQFEKPDVKKLLEKRRFPNNHHWYAVTFANAAEQYNASKAWNQKSADVCAETTWRCFENPFVEAAGFAMPETTSVDLPQIKPLMLDT